MRCDELLRVGGWGVRYFAMLFGIGFALGLVRVPLLEPKLGARAAELVEAPIMLLAITLVGRWTGRSVGTAYGAAMKLAVGVLAVVLVLGADVVVGVVLRGMTVREVVTERDRVAGIVYYALVVWAAAAPWVMSE